MRGPDQKLDVGSSNGDELASISVERSPVSPSPTRVQEPTTSVTQRTDLPHQSEAARQFEERLKRDLAAGTLTSTSNPELSRQIQLERTSIVRNNKTLGTSQSTRTTLARSSRLKPLSPSKSLTGAVTPFQGLTIFDKVVSLIVYILKSIERLILAFMRGVFVMPLRMLKIIPKDDMAAEREKIARARAARIRKIAAMRHHRAGS